MDLDTGLFTQLNQGISGILPNLKDALIALLVGILLVRLISWIAQALISLIRLPKGLKGILISIMDALLWIFLIITVLQRLGLGNVALVFSGSIAAIGLALAAGASSLASDILAGIFLSRDRDFNVGDEVSAGEKPTQGIIEAMDMRRTRIRGTDGQLHIIPNSVIERKEWILVTKKKDRN